MNAKAGALYLCTLAPAMTKFCQGSMLQDGKVLGYSPHAWEAEAAVPACCRNGLQQVEHRGDGDAGVQAVRALHATAHPQNDPRGNSWPQIVQLMSERFTAALPDLQSLLNNC